MTRRPSEGKLSSTPTLRWRWIQALSALAALLPVAAPGRAQETVGGWEIRLVLDGSRHETRRVRALLVRGLGGPLEGPMLGPRFLGSLRNRGAVGEWPGLEPGGSPVGPRIPVDGLESTRGAVGTRDLVDSVAYERVEVPEARSTVWRREGSETPAWTVYLRDPGETVLSLPAPVHLPVLPERVDIQNRSVLWTVYHGPDGRADWALAIGLVGGSNGAYWEAFWRDAGSADPADLDQALASAPWTLMRHVLQRYRSRDPWRPLRAMKATLASVRYNRVEGGSLEVPLWLDLSPTVRLTARTRMSTSSYPLTGGVGLTLDQWPTQWGLEAYRELQDANRWEPAETKKGNSLSAFLHGEDVGHYFTVEGLTLRSERQHGMTTWTAELFTESDQAAPARVEYSLLSKDSAALNPGLPAEDGNYFGVRGVMEHQVGIALSEGVFLTRVWVAATGGDRSFAKIGGMVDALRSWGWWGLGARVAGGRVFGNAPVQREFFLGGPTTVRGFAPATLEGPVAAFGRLEAGFGPPVTRLVAFGDAGWAGETGALGHVASLGLGISFMEGFFRLDLAKPVSGGTGYKVYLAGNGLL